LKVALNLFVTLMVINYSENEQAFNKRFCQKLWLSPFYKPPYSFFIKSAGGGICLFASGAFPQSHGLDFESSF
jgi:hypothetical protein